MRLAIRILSFSNHGAWNLRARHDGMRGPIEKHCFQSEHNKIKLAQWMQQGYVAPCIKEKQPRTDHMYEMQSRFLLQMRVLHGHLAANHTHRTA